MRNVMLLNRCSIRVGAVAFVLLFAMGSLVSGAAADSPSLDVPELKGASWVWASTKALGMDGKPVCYFRKTFELIAAPKAAVIVITADNGYDLFVNGQAVGSDTGPEDGYWRSFETYDITDKLVAGRNAIGVRGLNMGGPAGLLAAARIQKADGTIVEFRTDASWAVELLGESGWSGSGHDDALWKPAAVLGSIGGGVWGDIQYPGPISPARIGHDGRGSIVAPTADFEWPEGIVFVRGFVPLGSALLNIFRVSGTAAYTENDVPSPAAVGHVLHTLVPARPGGQLRTLCDAGQGVIADPSVAFDGETIYFTMAPEGDSFFHIYRIQSDGTGLRALTDGPFHDYSPVELPDGRIVFSSTRVGSRDEYHGNVASSLYVCDADGQNIQPLTYHIVADRDPQVTADGSVAFIRSDNFLERAKVETQIHQVRSDGTGGVILLGADRGTVEYERSRAAEHNSSWLRNYGFGCPTPLPDGRIAAISTYGLVVSGAFGNGTSQFERLPSAFTPFDISPLPDGRLLCTEPRRGSIGVLDTQSGDVVSVHSSDGFDLHSPVFLGPRAKPPVMASHVSPKEERRYGKTGYLFCQNVFNTKQSDADLSRIKAIRVYEGKPFTLRSVDNHLVHIGVEGVELGTVPLAPDGSFHARVPADRALALQAIDAEGRAVLNELTWMYVRPGERRTCAGCHNPRSASPSATGNALAARSDAIALTGQGEPHRYRANNAANGGIVNLQLDRFREAGNINQYTQGPLAREVADKPLVAGRSSAVETLLLQLTDKSTPQRISAARRLGVYRDRNAVEGLLAALDDSSPEVRIAAALSLSACGNRNAVKGLLESLNDEHPLVAQAANVALEHLSGGSVEFDPYAAPESDAAGAWRDWFQRYDWTQIETQLIARLAGEDDVDVQSAVDSLGHVGGDAARRALRDYVDKNRDRPLRNLIAALRALGYLQDRDAVPLLKELINTYAHVDPTVELPAAGIKQELGWLQRPVYLAATAAEALGWIATPEAEAVLIEAYPKLFEFWRYTWWTGDHDWLRSCHSSVIHYRILEAFDAMASRNIETLVPGIVRSVPIDPDRAMLLECDGYETLAGRVVQRTGRASSVIETSLAVLGDPMAVADPSLMEAVSVSPPATQVKPLSPEARAAQSIAVVMLDDRYAPRVRVALERYRAEPPSRKRSWVCFFLLRALGKVHDRGSVDLLVAMLEQDPTEGSYGFHQPPNALVYKAIAPFPRAAAAYGLGEIGDPRAVPALLKTLADLQNAVSTRQMAAHSLGKLCGPENLAELQVLADDYPEIATRRTMQEACAKIGARISKDKLSALDR